MEFPHLGEHCSEPSCHTLDFLPFKCDCCNKVYCKVHIRYLNHACENSQNGKNKDFQVPLCPLCNQPVPYKRNEQPDIAMSAHIDRDCKSDPAEERRRKIFSNRCSVKGCKQKELIPFNCSKCLNNYCIRHRLEIDHECSGVSHNHNRPQSSAGHLSSSNNKAINEKRLNFFQNHFQKQPESKQLPSQNNSRNGNNFQASNMSESEALEYALRISKLENTGNSKVKNDKKSNRQEDEDEQLARAIAESESEYRKQTEKQKTSNENMEDEKKDCSLQ